MDVSLQFLGALTPTFREAGHILGSASVELAVQGASKRKQLVFSGDLGRYDNPVLHDPAPVTRADVLLVESTHGNRNVRVDDPAAEVARVVNEALARGGPTVTVPDYLDKVVLFESL